MIAERLSARLANKRVFARGVHPPELKDASCDKPIQAVMPPDDVVIPLWQHAGAPAEAAVETRTEVHIGTVLAEPGGFVSARIHSSVVGKTAGPTTAMIATGKRVPAIPIKVTQTDQQTLQEQLEQYLSASFDATAADQVDPEKIVAAAKEAGLVGMGGAAFPTHVKLLRNDDKPIDTLLINGCECEPCLTADDRLMREAPSLIVRGALLAARAIGAGRTIIAIEDNKPMAIEMMQAAAEDQGKVEIAVCLTKYPMGGERQLIPAVLGRAVPTGGLPLDVGVVVLNVSSALSLAHAVDHGTPLTHRILTVTGAVHSPGNYYVPIGVPISYLIEQAGGMRDDAAGVILGGPMMGATMADLNVPVTKGTSGITVLPRELARRRDETNCIKCGRCLDHCPLHLSPSRMAHAVKAGDFELANKYNLMACCDCGCCAYVCPAGINLVQYIKSGKAMVLRERARAKAQGK